MNLLTRASACLALAALPALSGEEPAVHSAAEIEPITAQAVERSDTQRVEPATSQSIEPKTAAEITPIPPAAGLEVHHAHEIEPFQATTAAVAAGTDERAVAPATEMVGDASASVTAPAQRTPTADRPRHSANPVEPLSNGLRLSMTQNEIVAQFGEPTEHTFDARTFGYPSFGVACGGASAKIWHLTLKQGVTLSSGIGVGSSRAAVEQVFGRAPQLKSGQYALTFRYVGDRVAEIKIDPANGEFRAINANKTVTRQAPRESKTPATSPASLVGTWYGAGDTKGAIELHADGTYDWSGNHAGRYSVAGTKVTFTGSLAAWNGGEAQLNKRGDTIEFSWTNADGAKRWFVFIR